MTMLNSFCGAFLLVGTLFVGAALSTKRECKLKVFDEVSKAPIQGVCLWEFTSPDCKPFVRSFNRSELPAGFNLSADEDSVERPKSIDVETKMSPYNKNLYPGMLVNWASPTSKSARKDTKGYLMIWNDTMKNRLSCRLFQFDAHHRALQDGRKLSFQCDIPFMADNAYYRVSVYSMPPPETLEESKEQSTFVSFKLTTGSVIKNYQDPGDWTPSLSANVESPGTIRVTVGHSPSQFNLTQFHVMLFKRSHHTDLMYMHQNYTAPPRPSSHVGVVKFSGLQTDEYKVVVRVKDPFRKQPGKCLCWVMEANNHRHCTLTCGSIQTVWFNVTGVDGPAEETTMPAANGGPATGKSLASDESGWVMDTGIFVGLGVGSAALVVVAVFGYLFFQRRQKSSGSSYDVTRWPSSLKHPGKEGPPQLTFPTVYIITADDKNPAHTIAVDQLAKYLKSHGQSHVIYPPWESQGIQNCGSLQEWSHSAIKKADHIVLVDSMEAKQQFHSFTETEVFSCESSVSETSQLFKLALDHFVVDPANKDKVIMSHFTEECSGWAHLKDPTKMRLPDQFPDLLRRIHNLSEEQAKSYMTVLPLSKDYYENVESGISAEMCSALRLAQRPLYTSMLSNDTGFAEMESLSTRSSLSQDQASLYPGDVYGAEFEDEGRIMIGSSHVGQSDTDVQRCTSTDYDGKSCVTVAINPLNKGDTFGASDTREWGTDAQSCTTTTYDDKSCVTMAINPLSGAQRYRGSKALPAGLQLGASEVEEDEIVPPPKPADLEHGFTSALADINGDGSIFHVD